MKFSLGFKSDPIEYRYTFEWLFALMREYRIGMLQLGSSVETFSLPDGYFIDLRRTAERFGIRIWSCFTSHRELGGFFTGNPHLEAATRKNHRRFVEIGGIVGAKYVGSNPGAVYRDAADFKGEGIRRYLEHMKEMMRFARGVGIEALTLEPMSSLAEPPSTPDEIASMLGILAARHASDPEATVPVFLCGDVSHGVADAGRKVTHSNMDLFIAEIPYLAEFHFKNTDRAFDSTFGFSRDGTSGGIVDPDEIFGIIDANSGRFPVDHLVGHLEFGGPKLGRDYSDHLLEGMIRESFEVLTDAAERFVSPSGEIG